MANPNSKNAIAIGLLVLALVFLLVRVKGAIDRTPEEVVAGATDAGQSDDMMDGSKTARAARRQEGAITSPELEATLSANPFLRPFERLESRNGDAPQTVRVRPDSGGKAAAPRVASFTITAIRTGARPSAIVNGRAVFVGDRIENVRVHAIRSTGVELRRDDGSILYVGAR